MSPQLNVNSVNKRTEFHVTILFNKTVHRSNSPCKPFGTGLAFKNLDPFTAFAKIMGKAKKIKAPARLAPLAVQVYHPRLVRV